jgi:hypothetical protein
LVPDFDPPLPKDATQRVWNWAHTKGVKKQKEEGKKKVAKKARRKEEHDKRITCNGRPKKKKRSYRALTMTTMMTMRGRSTSTTA